MSKRKRTLINVYGYPEHQTLRDSTPEVHIVGCNFEYFLDDYESLIEVET